MTPCFYGPYVRAQKWRPNTYGYVA